MIFQPDFWYAFVDCDPKSSDNKSSRNSFVFIPRVWVNGTEIWGIQVTLLHICIVRICKSFYHITRTSVLHERTCKCSVKLGNRDATKGGDDWTECASVRREEKQRGKASQLFQTHKTNIALCNSSIRVVFIVYVIWTTRVQCMEHTVLLQWLETQDIYCTIDAKDFHLTPLLDPLLSV